ncbi:hypothetical protein VPHK404_0021 [Vibrio phage K404]
MLSVHDGFLFVLVVLVSDQNESEICDLMS